MTAISNAVNLMQGTVATLAAVPVTYVSDATPINGVLAVRGSTRMETSNENGDIVQSKVTDWLIAAAKLLVNGLQVDPEEGDQIVFVNAIGRKETYLVLPIGGDKCFRPSDPYGNTLRIHTRLVGVV